MPLTLQEIEQQYYTTVAITRLLPDIEEQYRTSIEGSIDRGRLAVLLGLALVEKRETEKASVYFKEAKLVALQYNNKRILADALHGEAVDPFRKRDFKTANALEQEALQYAIEADHPNRVAVCYYMLGLIASAYGSSEATANYLGEALNAANIQGYLRLQIVILLKLAELSQHALQFGRAMEYAKAALSGAQRLESMADIQKAKFNIASIQLSERNYEDVLRTIEDLFRSVGHDDFRMRTNIHTLRGHVYIYSEEWSKAEQELQKALEYSIHSELHVRANVHHSFADLFLPQRKFEEALEHVKLSMEFVEKSQSIYARKDALRLFHECYKGLERYKEAHEALEQYNELISREQTDALNSRLEFHALKQEYEQSQLKAKEEQQRAELLRIELERKDQDLVEKTKFLLKQTESLNQFRSDLKAIVLRLPGNDPMAVEVRKRLKSLPDEQLNWKSFDDQFNSLHPQFLHNLTLAFPDLSAQERKMCPLLRLNLDTEEISKLMYLSDRSVENHRYRIRKKLGLTTQQKLTEFLAQY